MDIPSAHSEHHAWSVIAAGIARLSGPRIPEQDFPSSAHGLVPERRLAAGAVENTAKPDSLPALRATIAA